MIVQHMCAQVQALTLDKQAEYQNTAFTVDKNKLLNKTYLNEVCEHTESALMCQWKSSRDLQVAKYGMK